MPNTAPEVDAGNTATDAACARKRVHVAVGVISDGGTAILVARRAQHAHQGGLWEFPGGKVEHGEAVQDALLRELLEELAIEVRHCEPLLAIEHDYVDKSVLLDVWWIDRFTGTPHGREGQPLRWADVRELRELEFPAANAAIVTAVERRLLPR
jgi:8-oxo-dGTP diphosphatase